MDGWMDGSLSASTSVWLETTRPAHQKIFMHSGCVPVPRSKVHGRLEGRNREMKRRLAYIVEQTASKAEGRRRAVYLGFWVAGCIHHPTRLRGGGFLPGSVEGVQCAGVPPASQRPLRPLCFAFIFLFHFFYGPTVIDPTRPDADSHTLWLWLGGKGVPDPLLLLPFPFSLFFVFFFFFFFFLLFFCTMSAVPNHPSTSTSTSTHNHTQDDDDDHRPRATGSHPPANKPDPTLESTSPSNAGQGRLAASRAPSAAELARLKVKLQQALRQFPDFPSPGILFEDILPIFADPALHEALIRALELHVTHGAERPDVVVGLEARGFLFGPSLALRLGASFVPVRKKGKLPGPCETASYQKEYGEDFFQMQSDGVKRGQKVLIVDDIIATGMPFSTSIHAYVSSACLSTY